MVEVTQIIPAKSYWTHVIPRVYNRFDHLNFSILLRYWGEWQLDWFLSDSFRVVVIVVTFLVKRGKCDRSLKVFVRTLKFSQVFHSRSVHPATIREAVTKVLVIVHILLHREISQRMSVVEESRARCFGQRFCEIMRKSSAVPYAYWFWHDWRWTMGKVGRSTYHGTTERSWFPGEIYW